MSQGTRPTMREEAFRAPDVHRNPRQLGRRSHPVSLKTSSGPEGSALGSRAQPCLPGRPHPSICSVSSQPLSLLAPRDPPEQNSPSFRQQPVLLKILHHAGLGLLTKSKATWAPDLTKHSSYLEKSEVCEEQAAGRVGAPGHRGHLVSAGQKDEFLT